MSDKKISELLSASAIDSADISVLIHNNTDYQFSFATLLEFIGSNLMVDANISFGTTLPSNTIGKNGDVFINSGTGSFAQKLSGIWTVAYTIPSSGGTTDGTVLYGLGVPGASTGNNNDTYINTGTGIFYKKALGTWSQVFSMQTGPAGATGAAGTNGTNGTNGFSVLSGTITPSNLGTGVNGDFYINTSNYTLFGPKTSGNWSTGVSLIGDTGAGVPNGGTTGQILTKQSNVDFDTLWIDFDLSAYQLKSPYFSIGTAGANILGDITSEDNIQTFSNDGSFPGLVGFKLNAAGEYVYLTYAPITSNNRIGVFGSELEDGGEQLAYVSDLPDLSPFVPYAGAMDDVDLGSHDITADIFVGNQYRGGIFVADSGGVSEPASYGFNGHNEDGFFYSDAQGGSIVARVRGYLTSAWSYNLGTSIASDQLIGWSNVNGDATADLDTLLYRHSSGAFSMGKSYPTHDADLYLGGLFAESIQTPYLGFKSEHNEVFLGDPAGDYIQTLANDGTDSGIVGFNFFAIDDRLEFYYDPASDEGRLWTYNPALVDGHRMLAYTNDLDPYARLDTSNTWTHLQNYTGNSGGSAIAVGGDLAIRMDALSGNPWYVAMDSDRDGLEFSTSGQPSIVFKDGGVISRSGSDTDVALWATGPIPAVGSEGEIQFNSSNTLDSNANFYWDNINKRLGIKNTLPRFALDILSDDADNVIGIRSTNESGYSAIRFDASTGSTANDERGAIGYGNSGGIFPNQVYLETTNINDGDAPPDFVIANTTYDGSYQHKIRFKITGADGSTDFYDNNRNLLLKINDDGVLDGGDLYTPVDNKSYIQKGFADNEYVQKSPYFNIGANGQIILGDETSTDNIQTFNNDGSEPGFVGLIFYSSGSGLVLSYAPDSRDDRIRANGSGITGVQLLAYLSDLPDLSDYLNLTSTSEQDVSSAVAFNGGISLTHASYLTKVLNVNDGDAEFHFNNSGQTMRQGMNPNGDIVFSGSTGTVFIRHSGVVESDGDVSTDYTDNSYIQKTYADSKYLTTDDVVDNFLTIDGSNADQNINIGSYNLDANSINLSGNFVGGALNLDGFDFTSLYSPTTLNGRLLIGSNYSGSQCETDFINLINNDGSGIGGFDFMKIDTEGEVTKMLTLHGDTLNASFYGKVAPGVMDLRTDPAMYYVSFEDDTNVLQKRSAGDLFGDIISDISGSSNNTVDTAITVNIGGTFYELLARAL